jgi:hypothetical protein
MVNPNHDTAGAIAIDFTGNVLFGGEFLGTIDLGSGLRVSTGPLEQTGDVFVARYDRDSWTPFPLRAYLPEVGQGAVAK